MSLNTLAQQTADPALAARVEACARQEAFENPALGDDPTAEQIRRGYVDVAGFVWPVAIATEAEYASALAAGVPNPGGDEAVITDGMILAAVQANWPEAPP